MTRKRIFLALTLAAVTAISATFLRAQSSDELEFKQRLETNGKKAEWLEGSWMFTITAVVPPGVPPPPVRNVYVTFGRGGASILSDRQAPFANGGHGVWEHRGGNEFAHTSIGDDFDALGNFLGTLKVRQKLTLTGQDELVGVGNAELRDAAGNLLFSRCNTVRGERLQIEPLAPQCQNITPPQ